MRANDTPHSNAEARRRSGKKQSRTERRERHERRARDRQNPTPEIERRFGIKLQAAVDKCLSRLGVPHRSIDYRDDYARSERVELVLLSNDRTTAIAEVQFTLRRGIRGKIEDFLRAAIVRADRVVPRFYLEIEDHIGLNLRPMGERLAHALRDIVDELGDWLPRAEAGNVIGVALVFDQHQETKFFPMRLLRILGPRARGRLQATIDAIEEAARRAAALAAEAVLRAAAAAAKIARRDTVLRLREHMLAATERGRFYQAFLGAARPFLGFDPHPAPAFATSQTRHPLRMPFRR